MEAGVTDDGSMCHCVICGTDLSAFTASCRNEHVNRCCDEATAADAGHATATIAPAPTAPAAGGAGPSTAIGAAAAHATNGGIPPRVLTGKPLGLVYASTSSTAHAGAAEVLVTVPVTHMQPAVVPAMDAVRSAVPADLAQGPSKRMKAASSVHAAPLAGSSTLGGDGSRAGAVQPAASTSDGAGSAHCGVCSKDLAGYTLRAKSTHIKKCVRAAGSGGYYQGQGGGGSIRTGVVGLVGGAGMYRPGIMPTVGGGSMAPYNGVANNPPWPMTAGPWGGEGHAQRGLVLANATNALHSLPLATAGPHGPAAGMSPAHLNSTADAVGGSPAVSDMAAVGAWLAGLGLAELAPLFAQEQLALDLIPLLSDADLVAMGVAAMGHRRRILLAATALTSGNSHPTPPPVATLAGSLGAQVAAVAGGGEFGGAPLADAGVSSAGRKPPWPRQAVAGGGSSCGELRQGGGRTRCSAGSRGAASAAVASAAANRGKKPRGAEANGTGAPPPDPGGAGKSASRRKKAVSSGATQDRDSNAAGDAGDADAKFEEELQLAMAMSASMAEARHSDRSLYASGVDDAELFVSLSALDGERDGAGPSCSHAPHAVDVGDVDGIASHGEPSGNVTWREACRQLSGSTVGRGACSASSAVPEAPVATEGRMALPAASGAAACGVPDTPASVPAQTHQDTRYTLGAVPSNRRLGIGGSLDVPCCSTAAEGVRAGPAGIHAGMQAAAGQDQGGGSSHEGACGSHPLANHPASLLPRTVAQRHDVGRSGQVGGAAASLCHDVNCLGGGDADIDVGEGQGGGTDSTAEMVRVSYLLDGATRGECGTSGRDGDGEGAGGGDGEGGGEKAVASGAFLASLSSEAWGSRALPIDGWTGKSVEGSGNTVTAPAGSVAKHPPGASTGKRVMRKEGSLEAGKSVPGSSSELDEDDDFQDRRVPLWVKARGQKKKGGRTGIGSRGEPGGGRGEEGSRGGHVQEPTIAPRSQAAATAGGRTDPASWAPANGCDPVVVCQEHEHDRRGTEGDAGNAPGDSRIRDASREVCKDLSNQSVRCKHGMESAVSVPKATVWTHDQLGNAAAAKRSEDAHNSTRGLRAMLGNMDLSVMTAGTGNDRGAALVVDENQPSVSLGDCHRPPLGCSPCHPPTAKKSDRQREREALRLLFPLASVGPCVRRRGAADSADRSAPIATADTVADTTRTEGAVGACPRLGGDAEALDRQAQGQQPGPLTGILDLGGDGGSCDSLLATGSRCTPVNPLSALRTAHVGQCEASSKHGSSIIQSRHIAECAMPGKEGGKEMGMGMGRAAAQGKRVSLWEQAGRMSGTSPGRPRPNLYSGRSPARGPRVVAPSSTVAGVAAALGAAAGALRQTQTSIDVSAGAVDGMAVVWQQDGAQGAGGTGLGPKLFEPEGLFGCLLGHASTATSTLRPAVSPAGPHSASVQCVAEEGAGDLGVMEQGALSVGQGWEASHMLGVPYRMASSRDHAGLEGPENEASASTQTLTTATQDQQGVPVFGALGGSQESVRGGQGDSMEGFCPEFQQTQSQVDGLLMDLVLAAEAEMRAA